MVKGLGAGMLSGGVVGAIVMSGLSLYAPLPQDRIDAAPKLEATTAEPETATPTTETKAITPAENAGSVAAAGEDVVAVVPEPAVENAKASDAPLVSGETDAPTAEVAGSSTADSSTTDTTITAQSTEETSVAAETVSEEAMTTETTDVVTSEVEAEVAAPSSSNSPAVEAEDTQTARVQPSDDQSPRIVGQEKVEEQDEVAPTQTAALVVPKPRTAPSLPTVSGSETDAEPVSADTPIVLPTPKVSGVVTNRLPSVGGSSAAPEAEEQPEVAEAEPAADLGALDRYAVPVEGTEGKSLMSFVLIDSGENGLPRSDLVKLAIPVTVALDPVMENAAAIMAEYRAAGIEVVAIANDLPVAAGPGDVATAVSAYFDVLTQSVALMDPLDARIQSNRTLLQPVLGSIRETGHGLITYDRGLNTAQQAAKRESIPAATVFRVLDADLEESPRIKRYLDRAAFAANQDGSVVVVGRSYPETVKAMVEWSLEKKDASVAVVPVSAVMKAGS